MGRKITDKNGYIIENIYDDNKLREKVGERIKKKRTDPPYKSQPSVYKEIDIGKDAYINLEKGKGELKVEVLYRLANYFGCSISYLLGEIEEKTFTAKQFREATGFDIDTANNFDNLNKLQRKLVENFICSFGDTDSVFYKTYTYFNNKSIAKKFVNDEHFKEIEKTFSKEISTFLKDPRNNSLDSLIEGIENYYKEKGIPEEEIDEITFNAEYYYWFKGDKKYQEFDITSSLISYLEKEELEV